MKAESKYEVGQTVWFMLDKPTYGEINSITADQRKGENEATILYLVVPSGRFLGIHFFEKSLFPTKEELLKSL